MNRWAYRIAALILLLIFTLAFMQMYKSLVMMQRRSAPVTTT